MLLLLVLLLSGIIPLAVSSFLLIQKNEESPARLRARLPDPQGRRARQRGHRLPGRRRTAPLTRAGQRAPGGPGRSRHRRTACASPGWAATSSGSCARTTTSWRCACSTRTAGGPLLAPGDLEHPRPRPPWTRPSSRPGGRSRPTPSTASWTLRASERRAAGGAGGPAAGSGRPAAGRRGPDPLPAAGGRSSRPRRARGVGIFLVDRHRSRSCGPTAAIRPRRRRSRRRSCRSSYQQAGEPHRASTRSRPPTDGRRRSWRR